MKKYNIILLSAIIISLLGFLFICEKREAGSEVNDRNTYHKKIESMTLREKIAQMIISSVIPANITENPISINKPKTLCQNNKIGGFIFFKGTRSEYARLSNELQSVSETPLLISADFERGTGMRITDGCLYPNNMALGAAGDTALAYQMGFLIAKESRLLGVHQNYAPVCDVNNNPDNPIINVRSFGENPNLVAELSSAMIHGLQDGNMIATAKHFPGHGDTEIDSHKDLPVLNFDMERMNRIELIPFKSAINSNVRSIMIAHLSFPLLESKQNIPASLSPAIIDNLLFNELGFNGLVVTDALNMKGITKFFNAEQVALMCVEAGVDLILMPIDEVKTIDAIERAVNKGSISEERINISVNKILKAKEWLGLFENKFVQEADVYKLIPIEEENNVAQKIADASVTLVKDNNNIFPIPLPVRPTDLKFYCINLSEGKENINSSYFTNAIKSKFPDSKITDITSESNVSVVEKLSDEGNAYDYLIIAIYAKVKFGTGKISIPSSYVGLINKFSQKFKNLIIVSFGNPYLLKDFPDVQNYVAAYGDSDVSINAFIKSLTGEITLQGKLPITISKEFPAGTGLVK